MSSSLYEIIELPNGDIVLRRADEEEGDLLSIRFSEESQHFLSGNKFEVGKAMIEAGMEALGDMADMADQDLDEVHFELEERSRVLH